MCLALGNAAGYIAGGLTGINGFFNCIVILTHPSFRNGELSVMKDPWAGASTAEAATGAYLRSHPELMVKVASTALSHPEVTSMAIAAVTAPSAAGATGAEASNPWAGGHSIAQGASHVEPAVLSAPAPHELYIAPVNVRAAYMPHLPRVQQQQKQIQVQRGASMDAGDNAPNPFL